MSSSITVLNSKHTEFNFEQINLVSNYNIILHCVYDLVNQFNELDFLYNCNEQDLVVLWHPVEMGVWESPWMVKLDNIVSKTKCKLVYLTGCSNRLNIGEFLPHQFDIQFFPVFDVRARDIFKFPKEIQVDKTKKFMFINSKDTSHRKYILGALIKNKLLDQGTVSYQCSSGLCNLNSDFSTGVNFTELQLQTTQEFFDLVSTQIPIILDGNTIATKLPRNLYLDSYINIIGETDFINIPHTFNKSFVTEKTFNAIANNQMFIVVGHAGSLQLLRDLGYKTFDGIIDESYDAIVNNGQRLEAVAKEIVRFISRPIEELKYDYTQVVDIIEHNRNLLYSQNLQSRLQNLIDQYK